MDYAVQKEVPGGSRAQLPKVNHSFTDNVEFVKTALLSNASACRISNLFERDSLFYNADGETRVVTNYEFFLGYVAAYNSSHVSIATNDLLLKELVSLRDCLCPKVEELHVDFSLSKVKAALQSAIDKVHEAHDEQCLRAYIADVRDGAYVKKKLLRDVSKLPYGNGTLLKFFSNLYGESATLSNKSLADTLAATPTESWGYYASAMPLVLKVTNFFANHTGNFVDIGCGAGNVMLPFALCTEMNVRGVDISSDLLNCGSRIAARLHRDDIEFIEGDVRKVSYADADVMFIFSPFKREGEVKELVEHLKNETEGRSVHIVAGFSVLVNELKAQSWLRLVANTGSATELFIFKSRL